MSQSVYACDGGKAFDTLVAQFALAGYELQRDPCIDGGQSLCVIHQGWSKPLLNLDAARAFFAPDRRYA